MTDLREDDVCGENSCHCRCLGGEAHAWECDCDYCETGEPHACGCDCP